MDNTKLFSVNFDDIESYLNDVFFKDEKANATMQKANISNNQIKIIGILIISALKAYDLQHQNLITDINKYS